MEWWIYFRRASDPEQEKVVVLTSVAKLLLWIAKNGSRCCEVHIRTVEV